MEILKKHCFGDDPVFIEILNDQSEIFKTRSGKVNYEDPHMAIRYSLYMHIHWDFFIQIMFE